MTSDRLKQPAAVNAAQSETLGVRRFIVIGLLAASATSVSTSAFAAEKPPLAADSTPPTTGGIDDFGNHTILSAGIGPRAGAQGAATAREH